MAWNLTPFALLAKQRAQEREAGFQADVAQAAMQPELTQQAIPPQGPAGDANMPAYSTEAALAGAAPTPLMTKRSYDDAMLKALQDPRIKRIPNAVKFVQETFKKKADEQQLKYLNQAESYASLGDMRNAARMMETAYSYMPNGFAGKFTPKGDKLVAQILDEETGQPVGEKEFGVKEIAAWRDKLQLQGAPETRAKIAKLGQETATEAEKGKMYQAHGKLYNAQTLTERYKRGKYSAEEQLALVKADQAKVDMSLTQGKLDKLQYELQNEFNALFDASIQACADPKADPDACAVFAPEKIDTTRNDVMDIVNYGLNPNVRDAWSVSHAVELYKKMARGEELKIDPGLVLDKKTPEDQIPDGASVVKMKDENGKMRKYRVVSQEPTVVAPNGEKKRIPTTVYNSIYRAIKSKETQATLARITKEVEAEHAAERAKKQAIATEEAAKEQSINAPYEWGALQ